MTRDCSMATGKMMRLERVCWGVGQSPYYGEGYRAGWSYASEHGSVAGVGRRGGRVAVVEDGGEIDDADAIQPRYVFSFRNQYYF